MARLLITCCTAFCAIIPDDTSKENGSLTYFRTVFITNYKNLKCNWNTLITYMTNSCVLIRHCYTMRLFWTCFPRVLTLKMPRKPASENVVCLCRLLNIIANFSNLFLHTGKQWKGAVWSGSTLFAKMTFKITSRWQSRRRLLWLTILGLKLSSCDVYMKIILQYVLYH